LYKNNFVCFNATVDKIISGLRKVSSEMQTHKNSKLRDGTIPMVAPKPKPALTGSVSVGFSGQSSSIRSPRFELEGKKWMIENHRNNQNLSIKNPDMSQSVYVFQCEGSTIKIDGKVNNIVVDSCKKTSVIFNDVIAACEFINCQSVEMQVTFLVPISFFSIWLSLCLMFVFRNSSGSRKSCFNFCWENWRLPNVLELQVDRRRNRLFEIIRNERSTFERRRLCELFSSLF